MSRRAMTSNRSVANGGWSRRRHRPKVRTSRRRANIAAGERLFRGACAQCHGRTGRGQGSFPTVAGLEEEHIATRLTQYRAGERIGPNSGLMIPVASRLSDEDIANLAAFISTGLQ